MKIYNQISIKSIPEDFIVTEVPNLPSDISEEPKSSGFTILKLTKVGLTTLEALRVIARELDLMNNQVQCLGLKDEDGVTEQFISVESIISNSQLNGIQNACCKLVSPHQITLEIYGYSSVPLEVKKLHGNLFSVRLRSLTKEQALKLSSSIKKNQAHSFINYYDSQRFGLPGGPFLTHLIGHSLIEGNTKDALGYYLQSGNAKLDDIDSNIKPHLWLKRMDEKKFDFFLSAYTSYLWNDKVSNAIHERKGAVPVQIFEGCSLYTHINPGLEPTQTVNGYRCSDDGSIEKYVKSRQIYVDTNIFSSLPEETVNGYTVTLNFFLPMGCYATMAIKQLLAVRFAD